MMHSDPSERESKALSFSPDIARAVARGLIQGVLGREPEFEAVESYAGALHAGFTEEADGRRKPFTIEVAIQNLIALPEFGETFLTRAATSFVLATTLFRAVIGREPSSDVASAYANALHNGYPLHDFVRELIGSDEFKAKSRGGAGSGMPADQALIAGLIEDLLVSRLLNDGCEFVLPLRSPTDEPSYDGDIVPMLKTFAFLSDPRPVSGAAISHNGGEVRRLD